MTQADRPMPQPRARGPELEAYEVFQQQKDGDPMSGNDFLAFAGGTNNPLGPALQQLGKSPEDLSVAFGGTADGSITVFAFRIKGINADQFLNAYTGVAGSSSGATITDANLGGKAVKKVVTGPQTVYLYLHGDVIWTVTSASPTTLAEAFTKLP